MAARLVEDAGLAFESVGLSGFHKAAFVSDYHWGKHSVDLLAVLMVDIWACEQEHLKAVYSAEKMVYNSVALMVFERVARQV